jgi:hypothetical protein
MHKEESLLYLNLRETFRVFDAIFVINWGNVITHNFLIRDMLMQGLVGRMEDG